MKNESYSPKNRKDSLRNLAFLALLTGVLLVLNFTPLGFLKFGPTLSASLLSIPITIGAIVLGPKAGAWLGFVFGVLSFIQCFGQDAFGSMLLSINPFGTFVTCVLARVLVGVCVGLIFLALSRIAKHNFINFLVAALSGSILNTLFFMLSLCAFFYNTDYVQGVADSLGATNLWAFLVAMCGINAVLEACVGFVVAFPVTKAISVLIPIGYKKEKKTANIEETPSVEG